MREQHDSNFRAKVITKGYKLVQCKETTECSFILLSFGLAIYIQFTKHDIKHFGTFGSPKIAKHVHFGPMGTWERVCNAIGTWECGWKLVWEHESVHEFPMSPPLTSQKSQNYPKVP